MDNFLYCFEPGLSLHIVVGGNRWRMAIPQKLSADCILEALIEVRFNVDEPSEIVVGRLLDCPLWTDYEKRRTPFSDIPIQVRLSDAGLRYQPSYELVSPKNDYVAKIGSHAFSLHCRKPYPGWENFQPSIQHAIEYIMERFPDLRVERVGLRYINATTRDRHFVSSLSDLNVEFRAAGEVVHDEFNINYKQSVSDNHIVVTRVAAPSFVSGPLPDEATSFVDIDVHTVRGLHNFNTEDLLGWIEIAHEEEKKQFFKILPEDVVNKLREG